MTRALALAPLLSSPCWAAAQSPGWEEILGAARLYPLAIAIVEKNLGPDHPTLDGLLENYDVVLRRMRRDAEALEIHERARDICARHAKQNPRR